MVLPVELHTDQGRNFDSRVFHQLSFLLGIKKTRTTPFHPQSNDLVERQHQTLTNYLAKFVSENQQDWNRWIGMSLLAYRLGRHKTTGFSPIELCFLQIFFKGVLYKRESYILSLKKKINKIHSKIRERLTMKSSRTKTFYDRKTRQVYFKSGQKL